MQRGHDAASPEEGCSQSETRVCHRGTAAVLVLALDDVARVRRHRWRYSRAPAGGAAGPAATDAPGRGRRRGPRERRPGGSRRVRPRLTRPGRAPPWTSRRLSPGEPRVRPRLTCPAPPVDLASALSPGEPRGPAKADVPGGGGAVDLASRCRRGSRGVRPEGCAARRAAPWTSRALSPGEPRVRPRLTC